jgi:hypothetical protein
MQIPKAEQTFVMLPLTLDPPEHAPYRQILMQQFSAKAMHALEPHIRDWAERLLDAVARTGPMAACDFVASVSGVLPVSVFMQLMGLPLDRLEEFRAWVDESFAATESDHRMAVYGRIMGFMGEVIAARAQAPRDDLVSRLLASEIDGRRLSVDEVQGMSLLLFIAGMDTVANALSFGMRHLAPEPRSAAGGGGRSGADPRPSRRNPPTLRLHQHPARRRPGRRSGRRADEGRRHAVPQLRDGGGRRQVRSGRQGLRSPARQRRRTPDLRRGAA